MDSYITIVSGLPRSGTSMMMQMLEKAGQSLMVDGVRVADDDNPRGYLEFERIKKVKEDDGWLSDANGRVVKMVSTLIRDLPADYRYKVIFLRRDLMEVIHSQKKMLLRRKEEGAGLEDEKMLALYSRHLQDVYRWLQSSQNIDVLFVDYSSVLSSPVEEAGRVIEFLGLQTSAEQMAGAVDASLYRNKASEITLPH